jgi:fibronectin-binding autotransporter adhesin
MTRALAGILLCAAAIDAAAATYYTRISGNWTQGNRWSLTACNGSNANASPGAGDIAIICSGDTIVLDTSPGALAALTVNAGGTLTIGDGNNRALTVNGLTSVAGTLQFGGGAACTLNASGGISNSGTFQVLTTSNATHALNVGADLANSGSFNLATDANSLVNTTFNRNGNQTVSGAGATTRFNRITVNMGATNANILDITATNFSINPAAPTNFLTLQNGTFRFSTSGTITPFTADPAIGATEGFWLNNAGATVNSGNFDWTLSGTSNAARGLLRVSSGTLNLGTNADDDLVSANFSEVLLEGGALNIAGALRPSFGVDDLRFTMSAGTLTVATVGVTGGIVYPYAQEAAGSFTMSGGTIIIERPGTGNLGYYNQAGTSNVTGGTLQIGNAVTPAASTFQINSSPVPVFNLTMSSATAFTVQLQSDLTVSNAVTFAPAVLGNVVTGANTLILPAGATVANAGTSKHVAGNLRKGFNAGNLSFTYTVGDGTNYTPLTTNFSSLTTAGSLTVSVAGSDHPDTTASTSGIDPAKGINRYWTLKNSTLAGNSSLTFNYINGTPVDRDAAATAGSFIIRRGASCTGSGAGRTCPTWSLATLGAPPPSTTAATASPVAVASGDPEADFAVGEGMLTNFVRERQFIYTREIY